MLAGCASGSSSTSTPSIRPLPNTAASSSVNPPELNGTLLEPPLAPPIQTLSDTAGRRFSVAAAARTDLTLLYFGYTHCPDVCPTTVQDLAKARDLLDASLRDDVTVVFVTEDPERDTPAALRRWLDRFDPAIVGLIGGNSASRAMLKQLYLPETVRNPKPTQRVCHGAGTTHEEHGEYGIDHSGVVYAFAPQGKTVIYTGGTTATQYAADFRRLLGISR